MKIYVTDSDELTKIVIQLSKLNAECVKVHWSQLVQDEPSNVIDAFGTIEAFVENKIADLCGEPVCDISEQEEESLIAITKKETEIKESMGTGVICRGIQAESALRILNNYDGLLKVKEALASGKNVVIF